MFDHIVALNISNVNEPEIFFLKAASRAEAVGKAFAETQFSIRSVIGYTVKVHKCRAEQVAMPHLTCVPGPFRIRAIKAVRAETGWGLKDSKFFVDRLCDEHRIKY